MRLKSGNEPVKKQEEMLTGDCLFYGSNLECIDCEGEVKTKVDGVLENAEIQEKIKFIKEGMNLKLLNFDLNSIDGNDLLNLGTTLVDNLKLLEGFGSVFDEDREDYKGTQIKQGKVEFLLKSILFKKIDEFPYVEHPDLEFFTKDHLRAINTREKLEELLNDAKELVFELSCSIFDTNYGILKEAGEELKNLGYKIVFINYLVNENKVS